jgi:fructan beta-fructosidase
MAGAMSTCRVLLFPFLLSFAVLAAIPATYDESYRPQVHFSPREHWTNDPNGLVYFQGEYHLFFQFNPFGDVWGHMSWGHAVSKDLLHWQELPVAIPEKDGEMVFTGSVVVDRKNTSGFCAAGKECLVAVYTGYRKSETETRQVQDIAYSLDDGRTWRRYEKNPVLDLPMEDFRDPSVFWDENSGQWVMAVSLPKKHKIQFYGSGDLKRWGLLSEFGPTGNVEGDWECPDLLQVPEENNGKVPTSGKTGQKWGTHGSVWALKVGLNPGAPQGGSGEQYFLGEFDGKRFIQSSAAGSHGLTNYGKDDYCAINFNGLAATVKPVMIGWMSNWEYAAKLPTSPWRGQMSIPRRLSFVQDHAGMALKQEAVIEALRGEHRAIAVGTDVGTLPMPFELDLDFGNSSERQFGIRLYSDEQHWTEIGFDRAAEQFYIDRTKSSVTVAPGFPARTIAPLASGRPLDLKLIVDRSSVEAFAQDGTIAMTDLIFRVSEDTKIVVFSASGKPVSVKGDVWRLRSIWK